MTDLMYLRMVTIGFHLNQVKYLKHKIIIYFKFNFHLQLRVFDRVQIFLNKRELKYKYSVISIMIQITLNRNNNRIQMAHLSSTVLRLYYLKTQINIYHLLRITPINNMNYLISNNKHIKSSNISKHNSKVLIILFLFRFNHNYINNRIIIFKHRFHRISSNYYNKNNSKHYLQGDNNLILILSL